MICKLFSLIIFVNTVIYGFPLNHKQILKSTVFELSVLTDVLEVFECTHPQTYNKTKT